MHGVAAEYAATRSGHDTPVAVAGMPAPAALARWPGTSNHFKPDRGLR